MIKIYGNLSDGLIYGASFGAIKGIHTIFVDDFLKSMKTHCFNANSVLKYREQAHFKIRQYVKSVLM